MNGLQYASKGKNNSGGWWEGPKGKSSIYAEATVQPKQESTKELEMLVWGFGVATPRKEIIEAMENIMEQIPELTARDLFTFEKTSEFSKIAETAEIKYEIT